MSFLSQFRQPEYTGEHRCTPCTVVNVAIAAAGGAIATKLASRWVGAGTVAGSLGVIYLRGYLVPGTPQLTKQYLPDEILRWFEKSSVHTMSTDEATTASGAEQEIEPEQMLREARALEPCEQGSDLCLTAGFQANWREQIREDDDQPDEAAIQAALGGENDQLSVEPYGDAFVAIDNDQVIGQWPSTAAVSADVAAAAVLAQQYPAWPQLAPAERARVLTSLRIFIEHCPDCAGSVHIEQNIVESCCRSYDVVVAACQECEAQLFEIEWDEESAAASNSSDEQPTHTEI